MEGVDWKLDAAAHNSDAEDEDDDVGECVKRLRQRTGRQSNESVDDLSSCAFCRLLRQRGRSVETCYHQSQTATPIDSSSNSRNVALRHLFNAAAAGDLGRGDWLMLSGVDASKSDRYQLTPLHFAATHGRMAVVEFLVAMTKGSTVNSRDMWGYTPIDCTFFIALIFRHFSYEHNIGAFNEGHMHIVAYLENYSAKLLQNDSKDQLGVRLCALAACGNLEEIQKLGIIAVF
jgi:hypothetical protein